MKSAMRSRPPRAFGLGKAMMLATATLTGTLTGTSAVHETPPPVEATMEPSGAAGRSGGAAQGPVQVAVATVSDSRPGGRADCLKVKCVALTFDDGPGPYTRTLLRHLAAHHAHATFFVVGQNVAAYPEVLRQAVAAGHEIGNHTWSHPDLTTLTRAAIRSQLARTDHAVEAAAGIVPDLVRPPYGAWDKRVRRLEHRPLVLWSVDTLDWRYRDTARVARVSLKRVRPGSVILFHDIHPTTVKALPRVLKGLTARGYHCVTVGELFGGTPPKLVYDARRLSGGPR